jgi:hypothetical protein
MCKRLLKKGHFRTIGPSDYQTFRLLALRTIRPSALRTIGPSDYRAVTEYCIQKYNACVKIENVIR